MWQLQTPIYINQAKQIFNALQINNIKNSWLSTHFQKVQFLHKYRNLPLRKSFHIFFHTKDLFPFNRNWWNDNNLEGVFSIYILTPGWTGLFKRFSRIFLYKYNVKTSKKLHKWYFYQNREKIVLLIEKNFCNSRLKAENSQNFWDH